MTASEWNAHCDQWHAQRERTRDLACVSNDPAYLRRMAADTAEAYKLAHWRHRADEVCGYVPEDVQ